MKNRVKDLPPDAQVQEAAFGVSADGEDGVGGVDLRDDPRQVPAAVELVPVKGQGDGDSPGPFRREGPGEKIRPVRHEQDVRPLPDATPETRPEQGLRVRPANRA